MAQTLPARPVPNRTSTRCHNSQPTDSIEIGSWLLHIHVTESVQFCGLHTSYFDSIYSFSVITVLVGLQYLSPSLLQQFLYRPILSSLPPSCPPPTRSPGLPLRAPRCPSLKGAPSAAVQLMNFTDSRPDPESSSHSWLVMPRPLLSPHPALQSRFLSAPSSLLRHAFAVNN